MVCSEISKLELSKLVDKHFHESLLSEKYQVKSVKARELLTHNRLDLAFKLIYLDGIKHDLEFSKQIYKEHIRALSLGKFTEPGNENKNTIDCFLDDFLNTYRCIEEVGFDSTKTLIPLSNCSAIANGAHRVASAIHLDREVSCVKLDTVDHIYDYRFFYQRNVSIDTLDAVVTKFIDYAPNVHVAFIWPAASGHDDKIYELIPNIIYRKSIALTPNGAHNLLSQVYAGESWLGSVENNYNGVKGKSRECFNKSGPVRVVAFQAASLNEVLQIKDSIREVFKIGKHSIHITDTMEEAKHSAQMIFNKNGVHFLNFAKPNKFLDFHRKLNSFKNGVSDSGEKIENYVVDGSLVLSAYGLREARDVDYLSIFNLALTIYGEEVTSHDEVLKFHRENKKEIIFNPKYNFYFNEVKFTSFEQTYVMKKNRGENKDINDCLIMKGVIESDSIKHLLGRARQTVYYSLIKLRKILVDSLKRVGLYDYCRDIYRTLTRR